MTTRTVSSETGLENALSDAQSGDAIQFQNSAAYTLPRDFALPAGTLTLDVSNTGNSNLGTAVSIGGGVLTDATGGPSSLVVVSSATDIATDSLTLASANTYTGSTTIGGTGSTGVTLQGGVADAFGVDSAVSLFASSQQFQRTTLDLGGFDQHIGSLADATGSISAYEAVTNSGTAPATLHTGADGTSTTFSGLIENGNRTSVTALDKTGTGTFTLLGASNSYTGGTTLNGGTLELGAQSAAGAVQTGSQTAGGVAFVARGTTLQIDNAALFRTPAATPPATTTQGSYAAPVTNFASGETLDLSGLAYADGTTTASYDPTTQTLTVTNGTLTDTLTDFTLGTGLQTGYYTFATGQDANTTQGTAVTVSLNAPSAPSLGTGQDTGVSSTDGVTAIASPAFTGTGADPNATITLYDGNGATAIGSGTSDANGHYTATVTAPLAEGAHSITATVTDAGGDVSARSAASALTIDTTRPTIAAVSDSGTGIDPAGNGDLGAGRTVTLTVSTSEPVHVIPGAGGATPTLTLNDGGTATYTGPTGAATSTLTFSYQVAAGQNAAKLALSSIDAHGAIVTDEAGNPISTSLAGATLPSGTLTIDTATPTATSTSLTVAQNAPATPIGIAAPTDNLTAAGSLAIVAGTLPTDGTVTLADGTTAVTTGEALTAAQLQGLQFTPTAGVSNQGSAFTYAVTDGAGNASQGTAALNVGGPGAPTIAGTHATATTSEAAVTPFSGVTVTDPSGTAGATATLTIALTGAGGALTGAGLTRNADGSYTLGAASPGTVTADLDALSFTPTAGAAGTSSTTTFVLTEASSAGPSVTDAGTSVTDTDPAAAPGPVQPTPAPLPAPTTDTVSISPLVSYKDGVFTLTGTASSTAGIRSIAFSAVQNYGARVDLGTATLNADGTFTFGDRIGANLQGFLQATVTDNAGGTATSADPLFSLTGGLGPDYGTGRQRRYTADGQAFTADTRFGPDGTLSTTVKGQGQTFASAYDDTFNNAKQANTIFVFDPGFSLDVIGGFRVGGDGHDTLSFKGSDFGTTPQAQLGALLSNAYDAGGSLTINDPTSGDAVQLKGVTKAQLFRNERDIMFHA